MSGHSIMFAQTYEEFGDVDLSVGYMGYYLKINLQPEMESSFLLHVHHRRLVLRLSLSVSVNVNTRRHPIEAVGPKF